MAAQIFFSSTNLAVGSTITASGSLGTLLQTNVAVLPVGKPWRCNTNNGYVQLDFGSNKSVDFVFFACPRFVGALYIAPTDTVRVRADATGGTPGLGAVWDTNTTGTTFAVIDGIANWIGFPVAPISVRYIRISITATSRAAENAFDVGYVWAGLSTSPEIGPALGLTMRWTDGSFSEVSDSSNIEYVDPGERRRMWHLPFDQVLAADKNFFDSLSALRGQAAPLICGLSKTVEPARNTLLCRLAQQPVISITQPFGYTFQLDVAETL
jgi:hypothetical protein